MPKCDFNKVCSSPRFRFHGRNKNSVKIREEFGETVLIKKRLHSSYRQNFLVNNCNETRSFTRSKAVRDF